MNEEKRVDNNAKEAIDLQTNAVNKILEVMELKGNYI